MHALWEMGQEKPHESWCSWLLCYNKALVSDSGALFCHYPWNYGKVIRLWDKITDPSQFFLTLYTLSRKIDKYSFPFWKVNFLPSHSVLFAAGRNTINLLCILPGIFYAYNYIHLFPFLPNVTRHSFCIRPSFYLIKCLEIFSDCIIQGYLILLNSDKLIFHLCIYYSNNRVGT